MPYIFNSKIPSLKSSRVRLGKKAIAKYIYINMNNRKVCSNGGRLFSYESSAKFCCFEIYRVHQANNSD